MYYIPFIIIYTIIYGHTIFGRPNHPGRPSMTDGTRLHARLLGDADAAACFSGRAQLQAMLDVEVALAAAEGGRRRGAGKLRGADSGGGPRRAVRPGPARSRGDGGGQSGHSGGAASDRAGGGIRRAGGAVRPLGRDQPGHPGYRTGAAAPGGGAGRDRPACAGRRRRRSPRAASPRRHDGRPHLAAAGNTNHVRPQGRRAGPTRSTGRGDACEPPSTTRSCCSSEARRAPWRPSGRRASP